VLIAPLLLIHTEPDAAAAPNSGKAASGALESAARPAVSPHAAASHHTGDPGRWRLASDVKHVRPHPTPARHVARARVVDARVSGSGAGAGVAVADSGLGPLPAAAPSSTSASAAPVTAAPTPVPTTVPSPPTTTTTTAPPAPASAVDTDSGAAVTTEGQVTYYAHPAGGCASPWLPFGTVVRITNPANGASVTCVVNDREADTERSIDLATDTFAEIAPLGQGVIDAELSW
jgi:rare lipoprotein A